jgi:hypothetical protein
VNAFLSLKRLKRALAYLPQEKKIEKEKISTPN